MSFRLRNAAQTFKRFMDDILRGLDFCFAYLDDILVFSWPFEEHERTFQYVKIVGYFSNAPLYYIS
jgi:hypothetical protein